MAKPSLPKGLSRRTNGTYYTRDRRNGRDRWVSFGRDRAEALRRFRDFQLDRDGFRRRRDWTVEEIGQRWLQTYIPNARTTAGQQLAAAWLRKYLGPFLGSTMVQNVVPDDLRRYRLWLEKQTGPGGRSLAVETVRHILSDARCMFSWAEDAGYMSASPFPRKLLPRVPKKHPDVLTDEEVAVLTHLKDPYGFTIRLGLATGLRWGDLTRVQRGHIRGMMLEVEIGKTGEARRLPLRPEIRAEIRSRIGQLVPFSVKSNGSFTRVVRRLSGVHRFHIHQLRHTAAMRLLNDGWRIEAVQEILAHRSVTTTQRYARFSESMIQAEAERLWGGGGSERKTVAER